MTLDYLISILKIVLVDLVLSGDNAVVIAMAAYLLPPRQRRKAMFWGCFLAIAMRVMLTLVVSHLLLFPGLRFIGAALLAWIACKLIQEEAESRDTTRPPPTTLPKAITRIAMADFIMSLDNVVAIAGVSQSDPVRVVLGLVLSISMILSLSAVIMAILNRYHWIVYAGTAVLALTAAEMMEHDLDFLRIAALGGKDESGLPAWVKWTLRASVVIACLTSHWWWPKPKAVPAEEPVDQTSRPLESVID
jgi:YjbE family integral membrane protein